MMDTDVPYSIKQGVSTEKNWYRPHDPGHNYHDAGIYLITLVVGHREPLLGSLNNDAWHPGVILSDIGRRLWEQWEKTPALQAKHGNRVILHHQVVMPDHWHGVIEVCHHMDWSLGDIIQAVKASLTSYWRRQTGYKEDRLVSERIRNMQHAERQAYYATRPRIEQPLFDDNYDDTICLRNADGSYDSRHFHAMTHYVEDNPRRAIIMRQHPTFMQRCLHLVIGGECDQSTGTVIGGRDYAAFGNLFLLRWSRKVQVFCHRKARLWQLIAEEKARYGYTYPASPELTTHIPYTDTAAWQQEHDEWIRQVMDGQTVLVTPGISPGEKAMKNECLSKGYPLIHIQKDPIGRYWKPEQERFAACERGRLLILAPWHPELMGEVNGAPTDSDYSIFHNLNDVAKEIADFEGVARVVKMYEKN